MKKKFVSYFDIGEVPRSPGKWNWNWLYFLPLIFTFEQGVTHLKSDRYTHLLPTSVGNDSSLARCWSDTRIYQHRWVGQIWKNNWKINEEWMKNEWIIYVSSYIRYFVHRQRSALILFHSVFQPCIYISMKKYKMGCYICILLFSSFFSKRVNKRNAFFVAFKSRWVINQLKTVTENSSAAECQSQLYGRTFTRDDKIVFIFC